ncbi:hypothetical protein NA57DRAFT_7621, partial [Rhizodiscina lignyota]
LEAELTARKLPLLYEDFTPEQSRRLSITLAPFIKAQIPDTRPSPSTSKYLLPPSHHLVYVNPVLTSDKLLPDGTDPLQSPGPPFVRRMWGGGSLRPGPNYDSMTMDGGKLVCLEGIRDVAVKGKPGNEKVFVGIERRMMKLDDTTESEDSIRSRLWKDTAEDFGDAALIERRNIAFMYERSPEELKAVTEGSGVAKPQKMLKPQNAPDFTHTIDQPTAKLLFRYSALTMNAHAIHLDPHYCRTVEGHRDLLFHGPLSFTFLIYLLGLQKDKATGKPLKKLVNVEYRNLAPLYCWEPIKLCGREIESGKYEIWAETPEGGIAVKGTAL